MDKGKILPSTQCELFLFSASAAAAAPAFSAAAVLHNQIRRVAAADCWQRRPPNHSARIGTSFPLRAPLAPRHCAGAAAGRRVSPAREHLPRRKIVIANKRPRRPRACNQRRPIKAANQAARRQYTGFLRAAGMNQRGCNYARRAGQGPLARKGLSPASDCGERKPINKGQRRRKNEGGEELDNGIKVRERSKAPLP